MATYFCENFAGKLLKFFASTLVAKNLLIGVRGKRRGRRLFAR